MNSGFARVVAVRATLLWTTLLWTAASYATPSPYVGEETRNIKALSPEVIEAYQNGQGFGFAKAAELNGYPGPSHVLEMQQQLALSEDQLAKTQALFARMQSAAIAAGNRLIDAEARLDAAFSAGKADESKIDQAALQTQLQTIAELTAELRFIHLNAHLEQTALLTPHQVERYNQLRGYRDEHDGKPAAHHGNHGDHATKH